MSATGRSLGRRSVVALAVAAAAAARAHAADDLAGAMELQTESGLLPAYRAQPGGAGPFAGVIVAGDTAASASFSAEFCRRLAGAGYFALAPDLWTAGDDPPPVEIARVLDAAVEWAGRHGADRSRLGLVGFGRSGRAAWLYAAQTPALQAVVAWGGSVVAPKQAAAIRAPLLGLYGEFDPDNTRAALLAAETRALAAGATVQIIRYLGVGREFAAGGGASSARAAAMDGWTRTLSWLDHHAKSRNL